MSKINPFKRILWGGLALFLTSPLLALSLQQEPMVGELTRNSLSVYWKTDEPCQGSILIMDAKGKPIKTVKETLKANTTIHQVNVKGLKTDTSYYYSVMGNRDQISFKDDPIPVFTGVTPGKPFRFVSMADSRGKQNGVNVEVFAKIINQVALAKPRFVVFQGDLISGSKSLETARIQFDQWKKTAQPLIQSVPIFMGIGGHEMEVKPVKKQDSESLFRDEFFQLPENGPDHLKGLVYSFDFSNAHFVMLDSYAQGTSYYLSPMQLDWLEQNLKSSSMMHKFIGSS